MNNVVYIYVSEVGEGQRERDTDKRRYQVIESVQGTSHEPLLFMVQLFWCGLLWHGVCCDDALLRQQHAPNFVVKFVRPASCVRACVLRRQHSRHASIRTTNKVSYPIFHHPSHIATDITQHQSRIPLRSVSSHPSPLSPSPLTPHPSPLSPLPSPLSPLPSPLSPLPSPLELIYFSVIPAFNEDETKGLFLQKKGQRWSSSDLLTDRGR